MWEIYSIGDSAYLAAILNAVAMISGTGDFRQLAGVGFLLGVLLVLFQGILQGGQGIRFQNVLVAWLLYALMFGPTARVAPPGTGCGTSTRRGPRRGYGPIQPSLLYWPRRFRPHTGAK